MTRLPGHRFLGSDPDGFMTGAEVVGLLDDYRDRIHAPVRTHTEVVSVESTWPGFRTTTTTGVIESAAVVVPTGACSTSNIPTIAEELRRHGHDVILAVGDHVRLPRTYRGMDIHWWMDTIGLLDERFDEVADLERARRLPSLQLVGLAGKTAQFSGSFANCCTSADLKLDRLLDTIDRYATDRGLDARPFPKRGRPSTCPTFGP